MTGDSGDSRALLSVEDAIKACQSVQLSRRALSAVDVSNPPPFPIRNGARGVIDMHSLQHYIVFILKRDNIHTDNFHAVRPMRGPTI